MMVLKDLRPSTQSYGTVCMDQVNTKTRLY
jgi:hypothetical protein